MDTITASTVAPNLGLQTSIVQAALGGGVHTKTGELAINASKGVLRMGGGKISKNNAITITTPSSTIRIRGGITILDFKDRRTESTFVFGKDMSARGAGQTQIATRVR